MLRYYTHGMEDVKSPRDRRARQAAATRARIIEAAGRLFSERGYGSTTIDSIAEEADVAVETVYARFKNKRNLLDAYLDVSIVGDASPVALLDRPDVRAVRDAMNQRDQVKLLARIMRGVLERNARAHAVLRSALGTDPELDALIEQDDERRKQTHRSFVETLRTRGALRAGLSVSDAIDTMSAIAHPDTYFFLTSRRGWTAARYERWLTDSLRLLLLPTNE